MENPATLLSSGLDRIFDEERRRKQAVYESQIAIPHLLSGIASFEALKDAVESLRRIAPDDCDVLVLVHDVTVRKIGFFEPHTFSFEGLDQNGHRTWVIRHFTQLDARVVYRPKSGPTRWVTEMELIRSQMV